ncbi:MAG: FAD-dependent oxidoreductase [Chloroflexi bacterium]|nr:FAD-dependent oxidoreductase [Chloroflexota bacterium]MYE42312.1 FAD-dependent oxidoreductase [Chloroflexota bacterium]
MVTPRKPANVAVIGAGIMGAAIAFRLARRGVSVALFDASQPGHGASSHSFAWINAGAKEPIGYHNLNRRSLEMWPRFAAEIGDHGDPDSIGLRWGGKVSWESSPVAAEGLAARVRQLQSWGYPTRLIDADELKRLEPSLDIGPVAAAEYSPNEGQVEPQMVVDACLRRLLESGCEIHANTEVHGFERSDDGRIRSLAAASGSRDVDAVIIAAGVSTTRLAALANVNVPQAQSPGVVIRTNPLPPLLHNVPVVYAPPLDDGRREIHLRQCADGRMMIGEGDQESLAEDDTQAHADDLLARACRYLPGLADAQAVPVPVGWRPMPLDGYPVMGFASEAPNLYVALTHSGVTLAPALSQLAAQEICDGVPADAVLGPYRPQRFAGLTPEDAAAAVHPRAARAR